MAETAALPGLVVDIEARIDKLEKGIAKANATQRRGATEMENRAKQSARKLEDTYAKSYEKIGGIIEKGMSVFEKGGVAVAGVGALVLGLKEVADTVAEVDREARKVGLSSKAWQQWNFVAKATGATIDGIGDGIKELSLRGAEFAATGKGSAADAFTRLGYTAAQVSEQLKDPSQFLEDIIGKLQKLSTADQIFNLDELFGGQGQEEIAKVLGKSVTEIQTLRKEAATFSDEQLEAAKKFDAAWELTWLNFKVYAKAATIEGVTALAKTMAELNRGLSKEQSQRVIDSVNKQFSPEAQIARLEAQKRELAELMAKIEATPVAGILGQRGIDQRNETIADLKRQLADLERQILDLGGGSEEFQQQLKDIFAVATPLTQTFERNATAVAGFTKALTELKNLVPGLKAELDTLAQTANIGTAYQNAAKNAQSWGELMQATDIAGRARSVAQFGQHDNLLDLIGAAEGTDKGRGYNETLGYGAFTGGAVNLTGMTLNEVMALQGRMLANPNNTFNSSAVGRYQITRETLQDFMGQMGIAGDHLFDEKTQDAIASAIIRQSGGNTDTLRGRWEGLQRVDNSTIASAYNGTPAASKLDQSPSQQRQADLLKQQADARRNLNQAVQEGLDKAKFEQSLAGMSESQKRVELDLYERLTQLKRDGVTLSDAEIQKLREKITTTDQLNAKNKEVSTSTEGLQSAQKYFAEGFTNSLSGLLTGTQTLQGAITGLLNSLVDAALQAALLGKGPLAGLFGGAVGGTGILGAIFGFASGGYTGNGGRNQPAGIVHKGEYVMSAAATRRLGAANLEALHRGALKGYAAGGYVGNAPSIRKPDLKPANVNNSQVINIAAPVSVTASGGTPEQNNDLARKISREMEGTMRGVVASEIRQQMRPGNMLNRGR